MNKQLTCKILISLFFITTCSVNRELSVENSRQLIDYEKSVIAICHTVPKRENIIGTGFIATSSGIVVTADHVIANKNGDLLYKSLFGFRPNHPNVEIMELSVIHRFRNTTEERDIALLKVKSDLISELPYISIADTLSIGEEVVMVGFPHVFEKLYVWPLYRHGIVASTHYSVDGYPIIVLDLRSVGGFSGSPVISLNQNKVIGVMKGGIKKKPNVDFSVAFIVRPEDIKIVE